MVCTCSSCLKKMYSQVGYANPLIKMEGLNCLFCILGGTLRWFDPTKLALMSFFFFLNDTFPSLPASLPVFGHIAYKSQDILVSGLQKAWPPGKACRTAVICLIRLWTLCVCVCASRFRHPLLHSFFFSGSCTAPEQVPLFFLHHVLALACWHASNHLAFPHFST